jgi:hypothetical protein
MLEWARKDSFADQLDLGGAGESASRLIGEFARELPGKHLALTAALQHHASKSSSHFNTEHEDPFRCISRP